VAVYLLQLLANLEQFDPNGSPSCLSKSPPHFGFPVGDLPPTVRKDWNASTSLLLLLLPTSTTAMATFLKKPLKLALVQLASGN
jgi:hypothetical protein